VHPSLINQNFSKVNGFIGNRDSIGAVGSPPRTWLSLTDPEKPRPPIVPGPLQMWTEHRMVDPKYLREHATRCWTLAAQTDNPVLKKTLMKVAQRSVRLAAGLEQVVRSDHQARVVLSIIAQDTLSHR
jgi:hypothetical protein